MTRESRTVGPIIDALDRRWMVSLFAIEENTHPRILMGSKELSANITLSPREIEVACMIARDMTSAQIGSSLKVKKSTVDTLRSRILKKLGVNGASGITRWAVRR